MEHKIFRPLPTRPCTVPTQTTKQRTRQHQLGIRLHRHVPPAQQKATAAAAATNQRDKRKQRSRGRELGYRRFWRAWRLKNCGCPPAQRPIFRHRISRKPNSLEIDAAGSGRFDRSDGSHDGARLGPSKGTGIGRRSLPETWRWPEKFCSRFRFPMGEGGRELLPVPWLSGAFGLVVALASGDLESAQRQPPRVVRMMQFLLE